MKRRDLAELAVRNLREALLRNALTTLGVAVGVASLVAMLSLGVGLQNLASQRLTRSGLFDAVFVTARGPGDRGGLSREGSSRENSDSRQNPEPQELKLLDEDTRQAFARLPNVTEVYPQIRFVADARYGETKRQTMVLALPDSSRRSGAFDAMKGAFFSSPAAQEAILQMDFAKELNAQPESLIGKELTLRYMERSTSASDAELMNALTGSDSAGAISILPRVKKFRIIGITDSDPSAGLGGFGGARVFLPLQVAEGRSESGGRNQENGLQRVFPDGCGAESPPGLRGVRSISRTLRQPRADRGFARHHQYAGHGHSRAPPRNRHSQGPRRIG